VAPKQKQKQKYRIHKSARFLDRADLAEMLGVSLGTIYRMETDGRLPKPFAFGKKIVRWDRTEIEQLLEASRA
jgi:excisionase family DNA binding protein